MSSFYSGSGGHGTLGPQPNPQPGPVSKTWGDMYNVEGAHIYDPRPDELLIGVLAADLQHMDESSSGTAESLMTETTFDTATDPSMAKILLTNGTGSTIVLKSVVIKGYAVTQIGGKAGRLNDAYEDFDDIAINGENGIEFGTDNIVTQAQLDSVAQWIWKNRKMERHTFSGSLPGLWPHLQPGDRYKLEIGGAGQTEFINSFVTCAQITEQMTATGAPQTTFTFYETAEAYKEDSSVVSRFLANGRVSRAVTLDRYVVASKYYAQTAHVYCDGVADDVQIQTAINFMANAFGGGIVKLTAGTYKITTALAMKSNVVLEGEGANTIIEKDGDIYGIRGDGGSGTELTGIKLRNFKMTKKSGDTATKHFIDRKSVV